MITRNDTSLLAKIVISEHQILHQRKKHFIFSVEFFSWIYNVIIIHVQSFFSHLVLMLFVCLAKQNYFINGFKQSILFF